MASNGNGKILTPHERGEKLQALLLENEPQIRAALPRHLTPERMIRVALSAVRATPELLNCYPLSVAGAIIQASQLGLEPGVLGQCWLVPYRNKEMNGRKEAQLMLGYRGLLSLARRSGELQTFDAHVVYKNDTFEVSYGTDGKLHHVPCIDGDPGEIRCAYAFAKLKDGAFAYDVMSLEELKKVQGLSKGGPGWKNWPDEMRRKVVAKRLCKWLPLSVEMVTAIDLDNRAESGDPQNLGALIQGAAEVMSEGKPKAVLDVAAEVIDESAAPAPDHDDVVDEPERMREPGEDDDEPPAVCLHAEARKRLKGARPGKVVICTDCGEEVHPEPPDDPRLKD